MIEQFLRGLTGLFFNPLPFDLLFFLTAFFLVFIVYFYWNVFENHQMKSIGDALEKKSTFDYEVVKQVFYLFPLALIAIIVQYYWPLEEIQFFPITQSSFFKGHLLGIVISTVVFIVINQSDNHSSQDFISIFKKVFAYAIVLYIAYLVVFLATMVVYMNIFPYSNPNIETYTAPGSNKKFPLSLVWCFIVVLFCSGLSIIKASVWWRLLLLIIYTYVLAGVYYVNHM